MIVRRDLSIINVSLSLIALIMGVATLHILGKIFFPVTTSILLAVLFNPIVIRAKKAGIPTGVSLIILAVFTFAVFILVGWGVYFSFRSLSQYLPTIIPGIGSAAQKFTQSLGLPMDIQDSFSPSEFLKKGVEMVKDALLILTNSSLSFLKTTFFIVLLTAFMILEFPNYRYKFKKILETDLFSQFEGIGTKVAWSLRYYLVLKSAISFATGLTIYLVLQFVHMKFSIMWGFLGFILNFIPVFGSTIVVMLTMFMALFQFPIDSWQLWLIWVAMPGIQLVYGQILEPRLQGESLNISPFIVVISVVFWTWLWGLPGAFLSVPLTVFFQVFLATFGPYKALAAIMEIGHPEAEE